MVTVLQERSLYLKSKEAGQGPTEETETTVSKEEARKGTATVFGRAGLTAHTAQRMSLLSRSASCF